MNINSVKIRMYRHGFGDCFLLRFYAGKTRKFTMLIDCGLKLNDKVEGVTLKNVRDDIAKELKGSASKSKPQLDVLVATHEHWDHVSGFHPDEKLFDNFSIEKLWFAWTENPEDDDAKLLNKGLKKRVKALKIAADRLKKKTTENTPFYLSLAGGNTILKNRKSFNSSLEGVLGFFGSLAVSETPGGIRVKDKYKISLDTQTAIDHLRTLAKKGDAGITYLNPGQLIEDRTKLPGIRIYVLGPPKSKLLNKAAPSSGAKKEVYYGDSSLAGYVNGILAAVDPEIANSNNGRPFGNVTAYNTNEAENIDYLKRSYYSEKESYRTVEDDWLDMAGALAMQMDSDTNNTSLVLAIEFAGSNKVLLFPGDAQVGNWLSWHDLEWEGKSGDPKKINATYLLNNTVFYKVGHHSSHNATLKEKGLELMISEDLVALVPEKEKQYNGIPFKPLLKKLREKTKGRLIVSADKNFPAENVLKSRPPELSVAEWKEFKKNLTITKLFVDYTVHG
jgi:hypothetical protein